MKLHQICSSLDKVNFSRKATYLQLYPRTDESWKQVSMLQLLLVLSKYGFNGSCTCVYGYETWLRLATKHFYGVIISVNLSFYVTHWLCYNIPFGMHESRGGQWWRGGADPPPACLQLIKFTLYITFVYKITKTRIMSPSTNKINSRTPALRSAHKSL